MTDYEKKALHRFDVAVMNNLIGNEAMVELIERSVIYLNLKRISDYAKEHGMSYQGVVKCRKIIEICGYKHIIDNE